MTTPNRLWQALLITSVVSAPRLTLSAQTQFAITVTAEDTDYVKARCDFGCVGPGKRETENAKIKLTQSARNKISEGAQGRCEAEAKQRGLVVWSLEPGAAKKVLVADYSFINADCTVGDHVTFWHSGPGSAEVSCRATAKILCQVAGGPGK